MCESSFHSLVRQRILHSSCRIIWPRDATAARCSLPKYTDVSMMCTYRTRLVACSGFFRCPEWLGSELMPTVSRFSSLSPFAVGPGLCGIVRSYSHG